MRFDRRQYLDLMTFGQAERPMFSELMGLLIGVEEEWKAQGATPEELDLTAFDWDWVPYTGCGANTYLRGGPPPQVLEDTPTYRLERDALGRTVRLEKRSATIPLPLDFPVRTMEDWLALKPLFQFHEDRIDWDRVEAARQAQRQGTLVRGTILGGYDTARELMGEENACLAYYDQPELMRDILATLTDLAVKVFERVTERITLDQLSVHEDFAGKSGPLIGPEQFRQFVGPYYRTVWDLVHARGTRLFEIDSDGNLGPVLDALLEAGITTTHPVEPAAGMDPVAIRRRYGRRLAMKGGIDKYVLTRGQAAIRAELEYKLDPALKAGGMVFGLDHRIPTGTPLEAYRYYVRLGREMLGLPPLDPRRRGWGRMAF